MESLIGYTLLINVPVGIFTEILMARCVKNVLPITEDPKKKPWLGYNIATCYMWQKCLILLSINTHNVKFVVIKRHDSSAGSIIMISFIEQIIIHMSFVLHKDKETTLSNELILQRDLLKL